MITTQILSSSPTMASESTIFRRPSRKQSRRILSSLTVLAFAFILLICLCPPAVVAKENTKESSATKDTYGTVIGIGACFCYLFACLMLTPPFYRPRNNVWFFIPLIFLFPYFLTCLTLRQLLLCRVNVFRSRSHYHKFSYHLPCSVQRGGRVEIIANDQGHRITPSWVSFSDEERL
jgi:hypothetical protein